MYPYVSIDVEDPLVGKRETLALVLGLNKARLTDIHRGTASGLYQAFLQGVLDRKWTLDAVDKASLKVREVVIDFCSLCHKLHYGVYLELYSSKIGCTV